MRLASKIFLVSALVIMVLCGTAVWSLFTVKRLVTANQEIATRAVPALRLRSPGQHAPARRHWTKTPVR